MTMSWDELVKEVAKAERAARDDDNKLFDRVVGFLNDYQSEEIEGMERETLPDQRQKGRKMWRGQCAFSFRVHGGKVLVRDRDSEPEEIFDNLEAAYRRMAVHMFRAKERAWAAEKRVA